MKKLLIVLGLVIILSVLFTAIPVSAAEPLNLGSVVSGLNATGDPGVVAVTVAGLKTEFQDVAFGQVLKDLKIYDGLIPGRVGK